MRRLWGGGGIRDPHSDSETRDPAGSARPYGSRIWHAEPGHADLRYVCPGSGESGEGSLDDSGPQVQAESQARHISVYEWRALAGRQLRSQADAREISRAGNARRNAATRAQDG